VHGAADQISVTVASAGDWYLAGVTGTAAEDTLTGTAAGTPMISVLPTAQEATHG
jgi:2-methylaconitate cis-trans-isomerase PrpF